MFRNELAHQTCRFVGLDDVFRENIVGTAASRNLFHEAEQAAIESRELCVKCHFAISKTCNLPVRSISQMLP